MTLTAPLVVLALALPQEPIRVSPPPSEAPGSVQAAALLAIEARVVAGLFERRPWLVRERGEGPRGLGLGRFGPLGISWWTSLLGSAELELAEIERETLAPPERIDHRWLSAWVRAQIVLANAQARERWDPVAYVERAERVLRGLAEGESADAGLRAAEVASVLGDLPDLWNTARRGLVAPTRAWSDEASRRLVDLGVFVQLHLPAAFPAIGDNKRTKQLFENQRQVAIESTLQFRKWLAGSPTQAGGPVAAIGSENWAETARALTGSQLTRAEIKARVLREMAALDRRALAGAPPPVPVPLAVLNEDWVTATVEPARTDALEVAVQAGLLDRPRGGPVPLSVRVRAPRSFPGAPFRLRAGVAGEAVLEVEREGRGWPAEMVATRAAELGRDGLLAAGVRRVEPGEALYWSRARERGGTQLWNELNADAWGLYALDWLPRVDWVENPFHGADGPFARELRREAARLVAAIEVHADRIDATEAALAFERRTGVDAETARAEVAAVLHDPTLGLAFLVYLEMRELERDYVAAGLAPREALGRALRVLLAHPKGRPPDLRELLAQ